MCVVWVGLWVGSAWWSAGWTSSVGTTVRISAGRLLLGVEAFATDTPRLAGWHARHLQRFDCEWGFGASGFATLAIPGWVFVLSLLAVTVAAWQPDLIARRRARLNHCPACNYDRCGIPGTSPCPECGAVPAAPAQAST